eukprot:201501_1
MTPIVQSNPNMECRNSNGTRAPVQETQTKIGKLKTNCQITSTHPPNQIDEQLHIITKTHHSALKPPNCRGRVHNLHAFGHPNKQTKEKATVDPRLVKYERMKKMGMPMHATMNKM